MKYKLISIEDNKCYGTFNSYEEAYHEIIEINHRIHLLCGGNYYIRFTIKEVF